jgi:AcrR family transcriptional regulator
MSDGEETVNAEDSELVTLPKKRGQSNQKRWDEILQAAGEVFIEKGYKATTIEDVAARVGLLPGSLYYYIHSKEDLLYEYAVRVTNEAIQLTEEPRELEGADAPTRLAALIQRWMLSIEKSQPWAAYNLMDQEVRSLSPERFRELKEQRQEFRQFIRDILEQGIRAGQFDPDMDPEVVLNNIARLLWTTSQWYEEHGRTSFDAITRWYVTFILRGISLPNANGNVP